MYYKLFINFDIFLGLSIEYPDSDDEKEKEKEKLRMIADRIKISEKVPSVPSTNILSNPSLNGPPAFDRQVKVFNHNNSYFILHILIRFIKSSNKYCAHDLTLFI